MRRKCEKILFAIQSLQRKNTTYRHLQSPVGRLAQNFRTILSRHNRKLVKSDSQSRYYELWKVHFLVFFLAFPCFPFYLCTTKTRHRDSFKGHREIKRKSLCLADVTLTNHRDAQHLYVQLKLNNMTKQKTMIEELKYRIARYRSMGNGVMCQSLNNQLRALKAEQ